MISSHALSLEDGKEWMVSSVYGPQGDDDKSRFLEQMVQFGEQVHMPWILNGDFNLTCSELDCSSGRGNKRLMSKFRHAINRLGLHDMPTMGRKYTWCNQQEQSVMARLDRVLFNNAWEDIYPISDLHPLSSNISDHSPLRTLSPASHLFVS